ncbi:hypothetical protein Tco_0716628, partial [Tanacetum coccineum]
MGGQLWWPDNYRTKKIDSPEAFEISVATIMSLLVTTTGYKGWLWSVRIHLITMKVEPGIRRDHVLG